MERRERNASAPPARVGRMAARVRPFKWARAACRARLVRVAALCAVLMFGAIDVRPVGRFGTLCQADYQNGWRTTLPHMWDRCAWFNDELNDTDTHVFYFNLHGARTAYSTCDGCSGGGADTVHLLYTGTHGGAINDTDARLVMWNQNVRALSNTDSWRLGDEATGCMIFAQYACETLTAADGFASMRTRWRATFRGGLHIALGSHDKLYDSVTTNETGEDFADYLQDGVSIKWAWFDGNSDWSADQDVKVLVTGTGSSDSAAQSNCHSRRDGMRWQNIGGFARLRDDQIDWWCSWKIDNY